MDVYDYYITPDEYEEAERNGINGRCLEERIRKCAWGKKKALTTPKGIYKKRSHMKSVMIKHGISYRQFMCRIRHGWDEWKAATAPLRDAESHREHGKWLDQMFNQRIYQLDYVELAAKNDIPNALFRQRMRSGWGYELASMLPISPSNAHLMLKQKYGDDYFRNLNKWLFVKIK